MMGLGKPVTPFKKTAIFGKELHGASAHTAHPVQREDPPLHGLHCSRQWSRCGAHGENFHVLFGPTVAAPNFPRPLQLQARCFWKSPEVASVGPLRRKTMKMKMQDQPWNKVLQISDLSRAICSLHWPADRIYVRFQGGIPWVVPLPRIPVTTRTIMIFSRK